MLLAGVIAAAGCGSAGSSSTAPSTSTTTTPTTPVATRIISLTASSLCTAAVGSNAIGTLTIANLGDSTLTWTGLSTGGAEFTVSATSGTIKAGEHTKVTVTFTPTSVKAFTGTLTVTSDATSGTATAAISATGTANTGAASPGSLDTTFGTAGKYPSTLYGTSMFGPSVAISPDCHVVVAGKHYNGADDDYALLRLASTGSVDYSVTTSFSDAKNENAKAVLVLPDERIMMAGEGNTSGTYAQHGVTRMLSNGTLDTAFGKSGKVSIDFGRLSHAHGLARQPDGKVLVVGDSYGGAGNLNGSLALARLNVDGSLDSSFGTVGLVQVSLGVSTNGHSVVVSPDGSVTVGGYVENATNGGSPCFIARFTSAGKTDTTFGTAGVTLVSLSNDYSHYCHSLVQQADGKFVLGGSVVRSSTSSDFLMSRFTTSGQLDTTFDSDGIVTTAFTSSSEASAALLQPDGKIVLGGYSAGKFALARYTTTGALDTGFATAGKTVFAFALGLNEQIKSLALQPDGKIVAVGYSVDREQFKLAVARLIGR